MGGNALKNVFTRRYQKDEYHNLVEEVISNLKNLFINTRIDIIKSYREKESFGDMDILIESDNLPNNWTDYVVNSLNPKEYIKNGDVFSFEYKEFQIDLIKSTSKSFEFSLVYFSYNDLGNLMGRISHKMGIKFGHQGLLYVLRDGDRIIKEITLSVSPKEAMTFLGYDFNRHQMGFDTLEDIFEFAISTPYFNPDIYLLDNRNHAARVRDAKRKTYTEFLDWLKSDFYTGKGIIPFSFHTDKSHYIPSILQYFPLLSSQLEGAIADYKNTLAFRKRFNGDIIRTVTGLEGKDLGAFISFITENNGVKDSFTSKVLLMSPKELEELILSHYIVFNQKNKDTVYEEEAIPKLKTISEVKTEEDISLNINPDANSVD